MEDNLNSIDPTVAEAIRNETERQATLHRQRQADFGSHRVTDELTEVGHVGLPAQAAQAAVAQDVGPTADAVFIHVSLIGIYVFRTIVGNITDTVRVDVLLIGIRHMRGVV